MMTAPSQQSRKTMTVRVADELPHTNKMKLGEIIGFIDGDGSIDVKRRMVSFCNSEQICIQKILDNFEDVFGISRDRFSYYLTVPFKGNSKKIKSKWAENLKVQKNILAYVDRKKKTKKKLGSMLVFLYNVSISKKIGNCIDRIRLRKEKDRDIIIGYLRGFFAAEGAVIPGKVRKIVPNSIQFPQKGRETPDMIKKFLDEFGIEGRVVLKQKKAHYYCVNITGFENFKKFNELGLADLHPEKKKKITAGLESYVLRMSRRNITALKLLHLLAENDMSRQELEEKMNRREQHLNSILYCKKRSFLLRKRYMEKINDGENTYWRITPDGREFLQKRE